MNPSTTTLDLNVGYPNIATVAYAVQGDAQSRVIVANLYDGGVAWTPPDDAVGVIRFRTALGTKGAYDTDEDEQTAVTWEGNVATLRIVQNALAVAGDVQMQLEFYTGDTVRISTFAWETIVQPSVLTDTEFMQTDYYSLLSQQIAAILETYAETPIPATETPLMDGNGAVGTSGKYARQDHVHPSDTSRLPTGGGTMTGNLYLKSDLTSNSQNPPASATYGRRLFFSDSNSTANGDVYQQYKPDGTSNIEGVGIRVIRNVGGTKSNGIYFGIDQNNNHTVEITDPDAWLAALFGTMTPITTWDTVVTAATGFSKPSSAAMYFVNYGKVAQIYFNITRGNTAVTGADAVTNFAQLNTGYRSPFRFGLTAVPGSGNSSPLVGYANGNGGMMYVQGPIAANQSFYVCATYILA